MADLGWKGRLNMETAENTDKWIHSAEDGFSLHITESGCLSIDNNGHVIVMSLSKWHTLGRLRANLDYLLKD